MDDTISIRCYVRQHICGLLSAASCFLDTTYLSRTYLSSNWSLLFDDSIIGTRNKFSQHRTAIRSNGIGVEKECQKKKKRKKKKKKQENVSKVKHGETNRENLALYRFVRRSSECNMIIGIVMCESITMI